MARAKCCAALGQFAPLPGKLRPALFHFPSIRIIFGQLIVRRARLFARAAMVGQQFGQSEAGGQGGGGLNLRRSIVFGTLHIEQLGVNGGGVEVGVQRGFHFFQRLAVGLGEGGRRIVLSSTPRPGISIAAGTRDRD